MSFVFFMVKNGSDYQVSGELPPGRCAGPDNTLGNLFFEHDYEYDYDYEKMAD